MHLLGCFGYLVIGCYDVLGVAMLFTRMFWVVTRVLLCILLGGCFGGYQCIAVCFTRMFWVVSRAVICILLGCYDRLPGHCHAFY